MVGQKCNYVSCCQHSESIYLLSNNKFQFRLISTFLIKQCHSLLHAEMADAKWHFHALSSINFTTCLFLRGLYITQRNQVLTMLFLSGPDVVDCCGVSAFFYLNSGCVLAFCGCEKDTGNPKNFVFCTEDLGWWSFTWFLLALWARHRDDCLLGGMDLVHFIFWLWSLFKIEEDI